MCIAIFRAFSLSLSVYSHEKREGDVIVNTSINSKKKNLTVDCSIAC